MTTPIQHPRDPLHGITLETILNTLVQRHGWSEMARRVPHPLFYVQSDGEIQPDFPAQNSVGAREGGKLVHRRTLKLGN